MNSSLADPFKSPRKSKDSKSGGLYKFVIVALILVIAGGGVYFFVVKPNGSQVLGDQSQTNADTQKYNGIVDGLRKKVLLPDESPTIATIVNLEEVKQQNAKFYESAQVGDIVIIFTTKALIYREAQDLIINVAPVAQAEEETPAQ